jgi:hypothetical protein
MNDLPTGLRGKILAVALCFLAVVAVYVVIVLPTIAFYRGNAERLQDRELMVQRLQRSVRALPELQNEADAAQDAVSDEDILLDGESDTVAAATLQSTVKDLVEGAGARLISSEILSSEKRDTLQRVGVHVSFNGNLSLLTTVLQGIRMAHPVIIVDNVDIHGADGIDQNGGGQKQLAIALDVYGFRPL